MKIRERILNEETIVALVTMVAEEIDAMAGELAGRLEVIEAELGDVRKRLERLYEALETSELTLEVLSPRIFSLRHREEQLEAARDDAETQLEQRRVALPNTEGIAEYVADFRDFLKDGTFPERKALIRNFVEGIEVVGDEGDADVQPVPMPNDGVTPPNRPRFLISSSQAHHDVPYCELRRSELLSTAFAPPMGLSWGVGME